MDGEFCLSGARCKLEFGLIAIGIGIDISFSKFGGSVEVTWERFPNAVNLLVRVILGAEIAVYDLAGKVVILKPLGNDAANSSTACYNDEAADRRKDVNAPRKPAWKGEARNSATMAKPHLRYAPASAAQFRLVSWTQGRTYVVTNVLMGSGWRRGTGNSAAVSESDLRCVPMTEARGRLKFWIETVPNLRQYPSPGAGIQTIFKSKSNGRVAIVA